MKRLLLILALVVAAVIAVLVAAVYLVDSEQLRKPIIARASQQLERPVELGELDLALFPAPALRLRAVRVGGSSPKAPPLLEVEQVRLRVAILPLFLGRVVLRTLELEAPRVYVELDERGRPVLPGALGQEDGEGPPAEEAAGPSAGGPILAMDAIQISDGKVEAGPWKVENLDLRGRLRLDRSAGFEFGADLPGLGKLRDAHAELEGLGTDALAVHARGEIQEGDLAGLRQRLELEPELAGRVDGSFEVSLQEGDIQEARIQLRGTEVQASSDALHLAGKVDLDAELGGPWRVDLTRSSLALGEVFQKPAGLASSLSGALGKEPTASALRGAAVALGPNQLRLGFDLGKKPLKLRLEPATLDLEALAEVLRTDLESLAGRVKLDPWQIQVEPLALSGAALLQDVTLGLQHGPVSFSGPLRGEGTRIRASEIQMLAGGQSTTLSGSYDISTGRFSLDGSTSEADVEALAAALLGKSDLLGTLQGRIKAEGPLDPSSLTGSGGFEITNGRIRGFSLLKQILGDLAALPILVARLKGKDLSRYEEEEFKRLAANFRLRAGQLQVDELTLEYRNATANLHGSVGVLDGALNLAGKLVIARELDAEIAGTETGREKVIPIAGIGGTVSRPRVRIDAAALASVAATYGIQDKLREKLEEKLGSEEAAPVRNILEELLRKRQEKQQ